MIPRIIQNEGFHHGLLDAISSKRRTEDIQPIRQDLADTLGPWMSGRKADEPLWLGRWNEKGAKMLRRDLRLSRALWIKASLNRAERRERNESGFLAVTDDNARVVDFHALRVTFITALARGGASVKVAQELARHSDPKLTMNVYTSLGIHDLTGALDALPDMTDNTPSAEPLRATGTYDGSAEFTATPPQLNSQQLARETVRAAANRRAGSGRDCESTVASKPLKTSIKCDPMRSHAVGGQNTGDWTRTSDLRAMNPPLVSTSAEEQATYDGDEIAPNQNLNSSNAEPPVDPNLQTIIEAWPSLSEPLRAAVLTIVNTC